ncbi:dnaJ homolog subfamily C member 4-like isoform X2 [Limulus polyphemus]|uniref:DnaJ homolog subfamily C member 4-like isoform X2 n=1 Tax=Limulus polyphemus TaxID=6850 RepID=A0ABM1BYJ5_LIMPO|nr:dnaJ homolog subfamily C member 4-like isoform X2 [Limulus polyphemus]
MNIRKLNEFKTVYLFNRTFSFSPKHSRVQPKCFYGILGLQSNCSMQDVRDAYVKLCKELHPDRQPGDRTQHKKFVQLNEAYSVLIRPESRRQYDLTLSYNARASRHHSRVYSSDTASFHKAFGQEEKRFSWNDETIWSMRNRKFDKEYADRPYYSIRGLKRVGNEWIVLGCMLLLVFGTLGHYFAFRIVSDYALKRLDEKDRRNNVAYRESRELARKNGNEQQLLLLKQKLGFNQSSSESDVQD